MLIKVVTTGKEGIWLYCVIQEVEIKKLSKGEAKQIETYETTWTIAGVKGTTYGYRYSDDCFDRQIRKAYRISIHESYREGGKVRKKQTVICTIGYYEIVDWGSWIGDYIISGKWKDKVKALGLPEEELVDMIYKKFQPIVDQVEAEFQQTEEYKAKEEHRRILKDHQQRVDEFTEKYGVDRNEYNHCYDVFEKLRNPEQLKKVKAEYKSRRDYERRSQQQSRSYYDNFYSNYSGGSSGGFSPAAGHGEEEKTMLKQFYRTLSKAYHPDGNPGKDTSEEMKLLNQLKTDWGV